MTNLEKNIKQSAISIKYSTSEGKFTWNFFCQPNKKKMFTSLNDLFETDFVDFSKASKFLMNNGELILNYSKKMFGIIVRETLYANNANAEKSTYKEAGFASLQDLENYLDNLLPN